METYGGVAVQLHAFLTSTVGGGWSSSRSGRFTPRGKETAWAKSKNAPLGFEPWSSGQQPALSY